MHRMPWLRTYAFWVVAELMPALHRLAKERS